MHSHGSRKVCGKDGNETRSEKFQTTAIYVMGGSDNGINLLDTVEKYDPATDRWTPIHSMGSHRVGLALVAL